MIKVNLVHKDGRILKGYAFGRTLFINHTPLYDRQAILGFKVGRKIYPLRFLPLLQKASWQKGWFSRVIQASNLAHYYWPLSCLCGEHSVFWVAYWILGLTSSFKPSRLSKIEFKGKRGLSLEIGEEHHYRLFSGERGILTQTEFVRSRY